MSEGPGGQAGDPGLRVVVRRSGGFAGIVRTWSLAEADLPPEEAARLRELAAASQAYLGQGLQLPPGVPDGFQVEIALERAGQTWTLLTPEQAAPDPVRALLDLVRGLGTGDTGRGLG
ncbi:protealysin inhibitor emfourin [Motilibacter aurantiacus]|uniref:protealysin inhibitor emfourin n=1 Tax=Motilibacter aurantiacus TaxID=2714955 RepID=UPI0014098D76|nr:protealysin inhibitor emfourin [Motilibacter aurantiacus]NHC45226.1 hypothetical protein [Motilibacter aurantiacus]